MRKNKTEPRRWATRWSPKRRESASTRRKNPSTKRKSTREKPSVMNPSDRHKLKAHMVAVSLEKVANRYKDGEKYLKKVLILKKKKTLTPADKTLITKLYNNLY